MLRPQQKQEEKDGLAVNAAGRGAANLVTLMSGHVLVLAVVAVSGTLVPRVLGVEAYGQFAAVLAGLAILRSMATSGLQQVGLRYLPPLCRGQDRSAAAVLGSSIWLAQLGLATIAGVSAAVWLGPILLVAQGTWMPLLLGVLAGVWTAQAATHGLLLPLGRVGALIGIELGRVSLQFAVVVGGFVLGGLVGVFAALLGLHLLLLVISSTVVSHSIPLRPALFSWPALRPYWTYGGAASIEVVATMLQSQLPIYIVATWIAPREAGPLAVAVHLSSVTQGIFLAGRRALMPILSEMEAAGQPDRLRLWGGLMMRYGVAGMCLITVGWALVGEAVTRLVFGETFLAVYASVSVMLLGTLCSCCGVSCTGLLYVRGLAGLASRAAVVRMAVTVSGLVLVVQSENPDTAYLACWAYTAAALFHWAAGYVALGLRGGMWLPLRRTLLLMLPVGLVWPATIWDAGIVWRGSAFIVFLISYSGLAVWLGLLPVREVQDIIRTVRGHGREPPVGVPEEIPS